MWNSGWILAMTLGTGSGGLRSRALKEGSGETSPAFFCRRSPAREPRAEQKHRVRPLGGERLKGGYAAGWRLRQTGQPGRGRATGP